MSGWCSGDRASEYLRLERWMVEDNVGGRWLGGIHWSSLSEYLRVSIERWKTMRVGSDLEYLQVQVRSWVLQWTVPVEDDVGGQWLGGYCIHWSHLSEYLSWTSRLNVERWTFNPTSTTNNLKFKLPARVNLKMRSDWLCNVIFFNLKKYLFYSKLWQ